jgi:hypothetical protein
MAQDCQLACSWIRLLRTARIGSPGRTTIVCASHACTHVSTHTSAERGVRVCSVIHGGDMLMHSSGVLKQDQLTR